MLLPFTLPLPGEVGCCFLTSPAVSDVVRLSNLCPLDAYNVLSHYFYISLISDFEYLLLSFLAFWDSSSLSSLLVFFLIFLVGLPLLFLFDNQGFIVHYKLVLLHVFSFVAHLLILSVVFLMAEKFLILLESKSSVFSLMVHSLGVGLESLSHLNVKDIFPGVPISPA